MKRPIIATIVSQHVEDATVLHANRTLLTTAPHSALKYLRRFDDRLVAHLDGISVAGEQGLGLLNAALDPLSSSSLFVATVSAIEDRPQELDRLMSLAQAAPQALRGLISALGWVGLEKLRGPVGSLLASGDPFRRRLGITACRLHGVDPGPALSAALKAADSAVGAEALRTAGTLGRSQLVSPIASRAGDDPDCTVWAAWSAVLLGSRSVALEELAHSALTDSPHRTRAFRLALQAMTPAAAHAWLQRLGGDEYLRWLVQGSGINGDPTYVPWLIKHMVDDKTARLAGEAFSLITGTDLALLDLERKPPENVESGPNDDPGDSNVNMDPDDGLPWPDAARITRWWTENGGRLQPGRRYFVGAPVSREHCVDVLRNGYQRQRILAAHYLCLLNPGTPLFNTSAPAWRQQRLLAKMS